MIVARATACIDMLLEWDCACAVEQSVTAPAASIAFPMVNALETINNLIGVILDARHWLRRGK
jgi:hypothetical protein